MGERGEYMKWENGWGKRRWGKRSKERDRGKGSEGMGVDEKRAE